MPETQKFKLSNSLTVYFSQKVTLPIVNIKFVIPAGSIHNEFKHGLSYLTSLLIDEGSGELTGFEISDILETLGTTLTISSNKEFTSISALTLKEHLEKSLEILSKILLEPSFTETDFKRESARLESRIVNLRDNPAYVASTEFNRFLLRKTDYEFPPVGYLDSINNLTNKEVKEFYIKRYSPSNSSVIIVGDLNVSDCEKLMEKFFGSWQDQDNNETNNDFKILNHNKEVLLLHKKGAAQSEIRLGHFSKGRLSKDFYARTVLNSILGGQFSSRINRNLREDKGFTYGAHSNYNYLKIGSIFTISTSVKTENTADALREIFYELDDIKENLNKEELDFSKSFLIRRFPSLFETYSQIANNIALIPMFDLDSEYLMNYTNNINQVNMRDVKRAALENIKSDQIVAVIFGDTKKIKKQMEELADLKEYSLSFREV